MIRPEVHVYVYDAFVSSAAKYEWLVHTDPLYIKGAAEQKRNFALLCIARCILICDILKLIASIL